MRKLESHGHAKKCGQSIEYMIWTQMLQRCHNPSNKWFKNYGGRGIRVWAKWFRFSRFLSDMGLRPVGRFLERRDNNKGYFPSNCVWATREENNNNRRNNIVLTHEGQTKTCSQWSRLSKVSYRCFHKRITNGWPIERALSMPSRADKLRSFQ